MGGYREALAAAFPYTVPVLAGYLFIGGAFGVMFADEGYGLLWAILMSVVVYAGSGQYLATSFFVPGFSLLQAAFLTIMVNIRHVFYGLSLVDRYNRFGRKRWYMIFGMTDETYSLICTTDVPEGVDEEKFLFSITLLDQLYWILGTIIGSLLMTTIGFSSEGIEFAMTALFIVMFMELWYRRTNRPAELIGAGAAIVCLVVFGADGFILPAMLLMIAIILIARRRIDRSTGGASGARRRLVADNDRRRGDLDVRHPRGVVPRVPQGEGDPADRQVHRRGAAARGHRDARGVLPQDHRGAGLPVRHSGTDSVPRGRRAPRVEEERHPQRRRRHHPLHGAGAGGVPTVTRP